MKCGNITINSEGRIQGAFLSWSYPRIDFGLRAVPNPQGGKSPTHEVIAKNPHGLWVQIGVAWNNKIKQGDKMGQSMYSIQLDEPTLFENMLKLAAFPQDNDPDTLDLFYDRKQEAVEPQKAAA